jgi:hypothetical protein
MRMCSPSDGIGMIESGRNRWPGPGSRHGKDERRIPTLFREIPSETLEQAETNLRDVRHGPGLHASGRLPRIRYCTVGFLTRRPVNRLHPS